MTNPVQLRPDAVAEEMASFAHKLGDSLATLTKLDRLESGVTDREIVYQEDKLVLYRFKASHAPSASGGIPVLIVYALVNRPYMTDLQKDRSMIRGLLEAGLDVYLIDWGYPDRADRFLTLDDYINGYIDRCVDVIREWRGQPRINILGICQGGTFSLCYTAMHQDKVKNLITMVTPVDFKTPDNMLGKWTEHVDIDLLVDTLGNIPGELLNWTFLNLKPFQLMGQKYIDMVEVLKDEKSAKNFMLMEKWIFDSPDQAGEAFRQFVRDFFQQNKLVDGGLKIGETLVDLNNIHIPVLNVYATQDHLVPPDSSRALKHHIGSEDYQEVTFDGGHIGIYVSSKSQKTIPPAIGQWLSERS
ncbi:MAG: class III poly(R)-hydroxyalkanoic acid synthase subunit PhaC [Arenicellales bacterium]|nr:class III poly(R)-hydroxyalkanoic acid synthase subunit PhaC [Arenicellales bacterium]